MSLKQTNDCLDVEAEIVSLSLNAFKFSILLNMISDLLLTFSFVLFFYSLRVPSSQSLFSVQLF